MTSDMAKDASLTQESKRFLEQKAKEGWQPLSRLPQHPLLSIHGKPLGSASLFVLGGPINNYGCPYFQVYLLDGKGELNEGIVAFGLTNRGPYAGNNWIELISFNPEKLVFREGDVQQFLNYLMEPVPPGGHVMIEYESPQWKSTDLALERGVPPVLTPLGCMMHRAGCISLKNWYISEGGLEGPRKLQGFKALNEEHLIAKNEETARLILEFLENALGSPEVLVQEAVKEAAEVLEGLVISDPKLQSRVDGAVKRLGNSFT